MFCTITAINITKYNNFLTNTRKTSILKHEHQYPDIETQIDTVIEAINNNIVYTNIYLQHGYSRPSDVDMRK